MPNVPRQPIAKSRLETKLFLGSMVHLLPVMKTPVLSRQVSHFRLWFDLFPNLSVQPAGEAQDWFQNLRTQNTELPVPRGSRIGLCLLERQDGFYGAALGPVQGRNLCWALSQNPEFLPHFSQYCPWGPWRHLFLFLWADFEMCSLQSGNVY